jgi:hypothetical protein
MAGASTPAGGALDLRDIEDPAVRATLSPLGQRYSRRIQDSGAFRNNARRQEIQIAGQRTGFVVLAAGLANDQAAWADAGMRALEWGLDQSGDDGSFPTDTNPKAHGRGFFLEAAARGFLLVREADASADLRARAEAATPQLVRAARWLAASPRLADLVDRDDANSNQLFVIGAALQETGVLVGDRALTDRARQVVARGLRLQTADGSFPEREGFDASYQSVSLEFLARYESRLPDGAWKTQVRQALRRGTDRLSAAIGPDGRIDTAGSTRTRACGGEGRGGEGRLDTAVLPLRLRYLSLTFNDPALARTADAVAAVGQGFNHIEQCQDAA